MIDFNQVDPRMPGALRWKIARHEYSSYDAEVRNARDPRAVMAAYALAAMQYAVKVHDKALAMAVMQWAQSKHVSN